MQILKAVVMGVVAAIALFWSNRSNPAITKSPSRNRHQCWRIAEPDGEKTAFGNKLAFRSFQGGLWWLVLLLSASSLRKCPYPILWFQHLGLVRSSCYDSSRHIGESHWLTQPSDNKIVFLEIVFHLEAKIIKFKVGYGVFLCQCAKAFPGNIIVLLRPF